MRGSHRAVCGQCLDDFADIWALKCHQEDCLRSESPHKRLLSEDVEVVTASRA